MPVSKKRKNKPKRHPVHHAARFSQFDVREHPISSIPGKRLSLHMSYIPAKPLYGDDALMAGLADYSGRIKEAMAVINSDLERYAPMITNGVKFEVIPEIWINVDEEQAAWNLAEVGAFIS